jgi:6-pyruvoyltetrahydropterin/6-carboxytetrahydropterin synthase
MYWIFVEAGFEASHQLAFADGSREPLHTHPWKLTAAVYAPSLNSEGLVMDFLALERCIQAVIEPLSGNQIENIPYFTNRNASAEAVARYLFDQLAPQISPPARLGCIELTEAAGCRARYQPET